MKKLHLLPMLLTPFMLMGENVIGDVSAELTYSNKAPLADSNPQNTYSNKNTKKEIRTMNSILTVGANYTRVNFEVDGESSFNGNLGGAHIRYEYRPMNSFYGSLEFNWRQGTMHGSNGKRDLLDIDTAEKIGYTLLHDKWICSFYTGFGFRYLGHHLHPSSSSDATFNGSFFPPFLSTATSLKFDYCEFYVPVGFKSQYNFNDRFMLGLNFEWMPQAFPTVQITPIGGANWNLENKLANFLVELPFMFNLNDSKTWILTINPFYERWQDGASKARTSSGTPLGLPENTYNLYGADLNLSYAF